MELTDEIRNYQVDKPLPAEKMKTSREYFALAVLKFSFPELFAGLCKAEAPDLQDIKMNFGVEVTSGLSQCDEQIAGESLKYSHAKTDNERQKCISLIQKCGGNIDEFSISYPVATADSDKANVIKAFQKKMKKINQYHRRFQQMGLAILIDIPMFFFDDYEWGKWLEPINKEQYDFAAIIHWSGVDIYNFVTQEYFIKRIGKEDMEALKKVARMAAEGIIKDIDLIWK